MPGPTEFRPPKYLASFGRRRVRGLKESEQALFDTLLPKISITLPQKGMLTPESLLPGKKAYFLEIGFGAGEHLVGRAGREPEAGFIGSEVFLNGLGAFLRQVEKGRLSNVRLFTEDARLLLETLPDASLDGIYILFPDPWPKRRHHKRRILSHRTLDQLARLLKPGAFLQLGTDDVPYLRWMLAHMLERKDFEWLAKEPSGWDAPAGHVTTRYQKKAQTQGRRGYFLRYIKRDSQASASRVG
jgi:tRNA (guanine-N7-)-methyltransferase